MITYLCVLAAFFLVALYCLTRRVSLFYVVAGAPVGGDGSKKRPFSSLQEALADPRLQETSATQYIYVTGSSHSFDYNRPLFVTIASPTDTKKASVGTRPPR